MGCACSDVQEDHKAVLIEEATQVHLPSEESDVALLFVRKTERFGYDCCGRILGFEDRVVNRNPGRVGVVVGATPVDVDGTDVEE
jgi:hypothetical protein